MSVTITLQDDLTVTCNNPGGPRITIPSGTAITFPDAVQGTFTGYHYAGSSASYVNTNFATALCAAADFLREAGGRAALEVNESEFTPQTIDGVVYTVAFGPDGQAVFNSSGASVSASPSASVSPSASASSSASRSPSLSPSSTPSVSASRSPSASPSASSDARLKTNIQPVENALERMAAIRGVSFNWIEGGKADMGVIAQEVQAVFPELVSTHEEGHLQVNYNGLIGALMAAVQELAAQVNELKPAPLARSAGN